MMSEKKKKVPQLRFPGFSGEWEERKLGDVAESFEYGLNAAATEFDGMNKYLRITDIDDTSRKFKTDSLTSPDIDLSSADNYKLQKGDVLFTRTGASVGKTYRYIESDGLVYYAGFLIRARIKSKYDSEFIFQNTLTNKYDNFIRITSQRSGQPGVNAQEYSGFKLLVTELAEQNKIGEFFSKFDNLITLHQRKLTHLQTRKKGLLQKMFPKDGEPFPELRFPGFTDAWEKRKLKDAAEQTIGGGTPKTTVDEFWNGEIPWIQSSDLTDEKIFGVVPNKTITQTGLNNSATKLVPANSIAIVTRVGVGKLAFMPFSYATSQDFLSLSCLKIDPWFCVYSCYKKLQSELHVVQGTSIKGITKDELLAKKISVPVKEEQAKIGAFFKQLDDSITLHQRKLNHLQNRKKALLQQLFV